MDSRPTIVVSQCLGFAPVRYNGAIIDDPAVRLIAEHADIVQVCPEVGIGLGVPRDPIHIQHTVHGLRLVQPATSRDITSDMDAYAAAFLAGLPAVHGFILKARSPSCGLGDVKLHDEAGHFTGTFTTGRFAAAVLRNFPGIPVIDEVSLRDPVTRRDFLDAARLLRERGPTKMVENESQS